jgi:nucleoid DNA-binding protein
MTGFNEIAREVRTKCPRCSSALDLQEVGQELFKRILEHVKAGERVQISGFGTFTAKPMKEREIFGFGETKTMEARLVLRFKASEQAKAFINDREPRERADRAKKRVTKKAPPKKKRGVR